MTLPDQQLEEALAKLAVEDPELYGKLFTQMMQEMAGAGAESTPSNRKQPDNKSSGGTEITPIPGFVLKTLGRRQQPSESISGQERQLKISEEQLPIDKEETEIKVFVNVCHSPYIPSPPLASDEEIQQALLNQDNSKYRVPLSLSPPRSDVDKCT
jgi:hypothetical protein